MNDQPNFSTWEREVLDKFAEDAYVLMQQQAETIEQLRQDFRDAMKLLRATSQRGPVTFR
jgi:hypothetical protein